MARFDALVFDMDGVLVDSEPLHMRATQEVLRPEGVDLPWETFADYVGTTVEDTWTDLIVRFGLKGRYEDYLQLYDEAVLRVLARPLEPEPGAWDVIAAARQRGKPLALASSSRLRWIEATLAGLAMRDVFAVIVSGETVRRGKPAPDIYLEAARLLRVPSQRCIAIEDAPRGVLAAKAAGMYTVALRKDYNDPAGLAPADTILNSLEEFDLSLLDGTDGGDGPPEEGRWQPGR